MMTRFEKGDAKVSEIEMMDEMSRQIEGHTICALVILYLLIIFRVMLLLGPFKDLFDTLDLNWRKRLLHFKLSGNKSFHF